MHFNNLMSLKLIISTSLNFTLINLCHHFDYLYSYLKMAFINLYQVITNFHQKIRYRQHQLD